MKFVYMSVAIARLRAMANGESLVASSDLHYLRLSHFCSLRLDVRRSVDQLFFKPKNRKYFVAIWGHKGLTAFEAADLAE